MGHACWRTICQPECELRSLQHLLRTMDHRVSMYVYDRTIAAYFVYCRVPLYVDLYINRVIGLHSKTIDEQVLTRAACSRHRRDMP